MTLIGKFDFVLKTSNYKFSFVPERNLYFMSFGNELFRIFDNSLVLAHLLDYELLQLSCLDG